MSQMREYILSEKGMKIVNVLFFLACIVRHPVMIVAYVAWLLYLISCIKCSPSKSSKIVYAVMSVIPAAAIIFFIMNYC